MISSNIDDEWLNFISKKNNYDDDSDCDLDMNEVSNDISNNLNDDIGYNNIDIPKPSEIYISTKSKIAYLTKEVDLKVFWNIPVISYVEPRSGVIKKQIKINSKTKEELELVQEKLKNELYYEENIISHIDNPNGRIKFKDVRKITIGISKKDIMSYRSKKKQAFYNCFVTIIRLKVENTFKEFHVKIFKTGKVEIPGVQNDNMYKMVLQFIIEMLQPFYDVDLSYYENSDTVLINSNFNCGFYINREALFDIIKTKYNIQAIYDPCSYPGIQCKFYFNKNNDTQTGIQTKKTENSFEVSFMIFRTGSILIVGMCDEFVLHEIYKFLVNMLNTEFSSICQGIISAEDIINKNKKKKPRKKTMIISVTDNVNATDNVSTDNVSTDNVIGDIVVAKIDEELKVIEPEQIKPSKKGGKTKKTN